MFFPRPCHFYAIPRSHTHTHEAAIYTLTNRLVLVSLSRLDLELLQAVSQVVGEELTHAAYRGSCGAWVDEVNGTLGWWLIDLEVIKEVFAVALPLCSMTSVTLKMINEKC